MTPTQRRVLILVADGLRPDLLDPTLMPTVARLARSGVRCGDHHAVYPAQTRVNVSALATGTTPGRHGIVANTMLVPDATEDHVIQTSNHLHLDALAAHDGGNALLVPSLGDLLKRRGERLAVASTGSSGSTSLWNRNDPSRVVNPNTALGLADLYDLREKLGELPGEERVPQVRRLRYATRAVIDIFLDDPNNRGIVLHLAEPDSSFHYFGIGSPESSVALRAVDDCLADLLDALDRRGIRDQFDLVFLSDHGHSTLHAHQTLGDYLGEARADLGKPFPPLTTASDYVYARPGEVEPAVAALAPLVEWLHAQPWVGTVMAGRPDLAALPGVVGLDRIWNGVSNNRRPLLAVSPRWSHERNEFGVPGTVMALTTQSALRSSHGSCSPYETHPLLILHGPSFREGVSSSLPTGAVDILPTVLTILGLPLPAPLDGRVLWETLRRPAAESTPATVEVIEPTTPAPVEPATRLVLHRVGATTYLHGAASANDSWPPPPSTAAGSLTTLRHAPAGLA